MRKPLIVEPGLCALAIGAAAIAVVIVCVVELVLEVLLSAALDGTFVVGVEAYTQAGLAADTAAQLRVASCAHGAALGEEEGEEFVWDGKVGGLLELLEGGEADQHFEEGEGGLDRGEGRVCRVLLGCVLWEGGGLLWGRDKLGLGWRRGSGYLWGGWLEVEF